MNPKPKPENVTGSIPSVGYGTSISGLVAELRDSFFPRDFNRVEETLIARETKFLAEIEDKNREIEHLRQKIELEKLDKINVELELKRVKQERCEMICESNGGKKVGVIDAHGSAALKMKEEVPVSFGASERGLKMGAFITKEDNGEVECNSQATLKRKGTPPCIVTDNEPLNSSAAVQKDLPTGLADPNGILKRKISSCGLGTDVNILDGLESDTSSSSSSSSSSSGSLDMYNLPLSIKKRRTDAASLGLKSFPSEEMISNVFNDPNSIIPISVDDPYVGNQCDRSEPPLEQMYSYEEYNAKSDEDEESWGVDVDDYISDERSKLEIEAGSSGSGSNVEKPQILDTVKNVKKNVKGKLFEYDDDGKIHLERSMLFADVNAFRNVLRDYVVQEKFDIVKVKNEKARVTAICASEGCPWRIYASPAPNGFGFMIKTYQPKHTCIRQTEKTIALSIQTAEKLKESLNAKPMLLPKARKNGRDVTGNVFEYDDNGKVHLERFMLFADVNAFRNVLRDYIVQEKFDMIKVKNEKAKVAAICASEGCPWRIYASPAPYGFGFMIKTYRPQHTCIRQTEKTIASSTQTTEKLKGSLNANPMVLSMARKKGREAHGSSQADSSKRIIKYAELLLEKNRGSVVKLCYHERTSQEETPVFKRIFVCLAACKDGFMKGCRPYFGLDGCHLKGPYGGVLLCAVSLDANNGLFPLAFAVVEVESKDSWSFFLECLRDAIGDDHYVIMSDRQKGLTEAVLDYFPNSLPRHCSNNLFNNFKEKFPSPILRELFWIAVKAPNEFVFTNAMEKIKSHDKHAYQYLMDIPLDVWSRHAFHESYRSPHITNNVCELFNEWIDDLRSMPVLNLVDVLRARIKMRFSKKFVSSSTWPRSVGPRIVAALNKIIEDARFCKVYPAGRDLYEVYDGCTRFSVSLISHACECNTWQISGLPCKHGAAAIIYTRAKVEDYCDAYYSKEKYIMTYSGVVSPSPDQNTFEGISVLLPRRPKESQRRGKDEAKSSNARRLSMAKCSNYGGLGHLKTSCQRASIKSRNTREGASKSVSQTLIGSEAQHISAQAKAKLQMQAKRLKEKSQKQAKQL